MTEQSDIQRDLQMFAEDLHQLEVEYGLFFAGRVSRPPMETRARVEAIIARWGRVHVSSSADRFRFNTLQSRFFTYTSLWDRALKAREEGRPGPLQHEVRVEGESVSTERGFDVEPAEPAGSRVVYTTSFTNLRQELDKFENLYAKVMASRRAAGGAVVPFHKFVDVVRNRVNELQEAGSTEVLCQAAVKDGRVSLIMRGVKADP